MKFSKSKILVLLVSLLIVMTMSANNSTYARVVDIPTAYRGSFNITIMGSPVKFSDEMGKPWINDQGRTMVPVRIIAEQLGYEVDWDQSTFTVMIDSEDTSIRLEVGKTTAMVNGKSVPIDIQDGKVVNTRSVISKDRTYVPLRFVVEALGLEIKYTQDVWSSTSWLHNINIITPPPSPKENLVDKTFDPTIHLLPDGRLTEEKTVEIIEKMIEGTTLKLVNGKHILTFNRPAFPEGFEPTLALSIVDHDKLGYSLRTTGARLEHNILPRNQSFVLELDPARIPNINFYSFTFSVFRTGQTRVSAVYEMSYYPKDGYTRFVKIDRLGDRAPMTTFDKNRLFEGM